MNTQTATWKNAQQAFEEAIASGKLSCDPNASNYAGHYMYMGPNTRAGVNAFKHSLTREYIQ